MELRDDINVFSGYHPPKIVKLYVCAIYKIPVSMDFIDGCMIDHPYYFKNDYKISKDK